MCLLSPHLPILSEAGFRPACNLLDPIYLTSSILWRRVTSSSSLYGTRYQSGSLPIISLWVGFLLQLFLFFATPPLPQSPP